MLYQTKPDELRLNNAALRLDDAALRLDDAALPRLFHNALTPLLIN